MTGALERFLRAFPPHPFSDAVWRPIAEATEACLNEPSPLVDRFVGVDGGLVTPFFSVAPTHPIVTDRMFGERLNRLDRFVGGRAHRS